MADVSSAGPVPWRQVLLAEYEALHGAVESAERARLLPGAAVDPVEQLTALNALVLEAGHSAICLSGGGIRSASFSVGVLQALARLGAMRRFDYLSTVSGGGFAGAWLTAWLRRAQFDPVARRELEQLETGRHPADGTEPEPVERVRRYVRYLSPREGALSADAWTLGATTIRNLLLNWLVLLPLIAAALLVPRLHYAVLHLAQRSLTPGLHFHWNEVESWVLLAGALWWGLGLVYAITDLPSYGNARRSQGAFVTWCLLPFCLGTLALTYFWALDRVPLSLGMMIAAWSAGNALVWLVVGFVCGDRARRPRLWLSAALSGAVVATGLYALTQVIFPAGVPLGPLYVTMAFPLVLLCGLLGTLVFIGTAGDDLGAGDLEWWGRFGAWVLIAATLWLGASTVVFGGPMLFTLIRDAFADALNLPATHASVLCGMVTPALGAAGAWLTRPSAVQRRPSAARSIPLALAGPAFIMALLATLSWTDERMVQRLSRSALLQRIEAGSDLCAAEDEPRAAEIGCHPASAGFVEVLFVGTGLLLAGIAMGRLIPVNKFSLSGLYRYRLVRTFLGASRESRTPTPFTGFDPADDLPIHELASIRPLHIANATLNMVADSRLGRQECKAEGFTFSPLHAGSAALGYRPAAEYAAGPSGALSLGTAITISGAAASPSMGMYSMPALTFLMTLLNARLGMWMGNPGAAGRTTWRQSEPAPGAMLFIDELLGRTTDERPHVYLSDGGHFENLGLLEMVRRRCRFIVVVDASADPAYSFGDLANAVRRVRIDLGVQIEMETSAVTAGQEGRSNPHCLVGTIRYDLVDGGSATGMLVYLKPALSGDEPADLRNYAAENPAFPNESTLNQWFSEAQFESYRMLGVHTVETVAAMGVSGPPSGVPHGPAEFCAAAIAYRHGATAGADVSGAGSQGLV